jgi:tRNA threonylcarbamoyladenosine biosynthesis protein TsaE
MTNTLELTTKSVEDTFNFGYAIGQAAENGCFIALSGDLGAGKTHFVQGLAKGLDIPDIVTSPTFNIMNIYEDGRLPLKHFDFYRLHDEDDLYNIGWDEYSVGGVTVAEWADLFPGLIPPEAMTIHFEIKGTTERQIHISWSDKAPKKLIKEIQQYAISH